MLLSRNGINMRLCMGRVFAHLTSLQSAIGCTSRATVHQLRGRSSLQVQFGTKNHCVFFFEQTDQARPVRLFFDLGLRRSGAAPRSGAQNGRFQALGMGLPAHLLSQPLGILKENFKMSIETILIIVLLVFLLGGGGWYWQRGRG